MCKKQVRLFSCDYMINDNEMRVKMKNRSHRYDINRPRSRHRHTYMIYKMYFNMMMVICIKQHLGNIGSTIHENIIEK